MIRKVLLSVLLAVLFSLLPALFRELSQHAIPYYPSTNSSDYATHKIMVKRGFENPESLFTLSIPFYDNGIGREINLLLISSYVIVEGHYFDGALKATLLDAQDMQQSVKNFLDDENVFNLWPLKDKATAKVESKLLGSAKCIAQGPPLPHNHNTEKFPLHGVTARLVKEGHVQIAGVLHEPLRESVELFNLYYDKNKRPVLSEMEIKWAGCVPMEEGNFIGDDLAFDSKGQALYVTNVQPSLSHPLFSVYYAIKGKFGMNVGSILKWNLKEDKFSTVPSSESVGPNGVALIDDEIYFAEVYTGNLCRIRGGKQECIKLGKYFLDGIHKLSDGTLLVVAIHNTITAVACLFTDFLGHSPFCQAKWDIFHIDPSKESIKDGKTLPMTVIAKMNLPSDKHLKHGMTSSVVKVGNCYFFGSPISDRIAIFCE